MNRFSKLSFCRGFTDIVLRLLAAGCPINAQSTVSGETALVLAASNGHSDSTRSLLLAGADPLIRIKSGLVARMPPSQPRLTYCVFVVKLSGRWEVQLCTKRARGIT
jgi:ankyrin repeat protein